VAILYFLADEPVQNHQQQDCRLIVEVHAPDGADIQWAHAEAEIAIKEKFHEGFALKLPGHRSRAACQYLHRVNQSVRDGTRLSRDPGERRDRRLQPRDDACGASPERADLRPYHPDDAGVARRRYGCGAMPAVPA